MRKDEKIKNICMSLKENGYITDYRYDHFEEYDAVDPPFAVYRRVAPENFGADGVVYRRGENVDFEIYASDPDELISIMAVAEAAMDEAEIFYNIAADTAYIESEDFFETLYEV